MATHYLLRLAVCLGTPVVVKALVLNQEPRILAASQPSKTSGRLEIEWCSLEQDSTNEMYMARGKEQSCMYPSTSGVDFVSFVRRPDKRVVRHPKHTNARGPELKRKLEHRGPKSTVHQLRKKPVGAVHRPVRSLKKKSVHVTDVEDPAGERTEWGDGHHGELDSYGSIGDECMKECKKAGYCPWCGDGNACCGKTGNVAECHGVKLLKDVHAHQCVEPLIDMNAETKYTKSKEQLVVWVSGYPRSGSSTLLSMVSATVDDNRAGGHTFSLFEPCHDDDQYDGWLSNKGCRQLLFDVSHCDFRGVEQLWGWRDPHSTSNFTKEFNKDVATEMCEEADIIAFKTVDWGHDLHKWNWLLNSRSHMKVLDMVRDPRAIYASWKGLEPFKSLVEAQDFYTLTEICDHFARNLDFKDERVKRVIFEDLMKNPKVVTRQVYEFLGEAFTDEQEEWIQGAFNAKDCPPPAPGMKGFTDCHTSSGVDPRGDEKWRDELTAAELAIFENSKNCQRVADAYNYPRK